MLRMLVAMTTQALEAIESERAYQKRKWPNHKHSPVEWLLIMEKCLSDAKRTWMSHGDARTMEEIRQIVAVGVAALEQCGAPKRFDYEANQTTMFDDAAHRYPPASVPA